MLIITRKYLRTLKACLLLGYLFLSVFTAFHVHHIELFNLPSVEAQHSEKLPLNSNTNGLDCLVLQNYHSVHTLTFPNSAIILENGTLLSESVVTNFITDYSSFNLLSNPLRAPPHFS